MLGVTGQRYRRHDAHDQKHHQQLDQAEAGQQAPRTKPVRLTVKSKN
jgi:hypothetical protein